MAAQRLTVQVGRRGLRTLATDAIKDDFMRGLIELITNADDSYSRLEMRGETTVGKIEVGLLRRPRRDQTILTICDFGEGMDLAVMKEAIAVYGEATSGDSGRGVFGMGLKDTINAFGRGTITSIKDGKLYRCTLRDFNKLTLREPRIATAHDRKTLRMPGNGTLVEVTITNPKVRIPYVDTLRQRVQTHVCLRPILADPKRTVTLRDLSESKEAVLRYEDPSSEVAVEKDIAIEGYPHKTARLTIRRAKSSEPLTQEGSYRTGGILIVSRRSSHQATLFGFDEEPYAARLFGVLRCDTLYELQQQGEMVVKRNRDGLELDHPFSRALWLAAKREVGAVVQKEREEAEKQRQAIENEQTRKRFREAVKNLNKIAAKELEGIGGLGVGSGRGPIPTRLPLHGFEFIPDDYRILVAERQKLRLRVMADETVKSGDLIQVTTEADGIQVITKNTLVPETKGVGVPATVEIEVEGIRHGAAGFVTASCNGKSAPAYVEVVSEKHTKAHHPRGGLFKEIKYEQTESFQRARFERSSGIIWINTASPSVSLYLEADGRNQGQAQDRVLTAELVTELACQEIAREKRAGKSLDIPPGVEEFDAVINYINRLKDQCASIIHEALVDLKFRRN